MTWGRLLCASAGSWDIPWTISSDKRLSFQILSLSHFRLSGALETNLVSAFLLLAMFMPFKATELFNRKAYISAETSAWKRIFLMPAMWATNVYLESIFRSDLGLVRMAENVLKYGKCFHLSLSTIITSYSRRKEWSVDGLLWEQVLAWSRRRYVEVGLMCIFTVKDGKKEKQANQNQATNIWLPPSLQNTCVCAAALCTVHSVRQLRAFGLWCFRGCNSQNDFSPNGHTREKWPWSGMLRWPAARCLVLRSLGAGVVMCRQIPFAFISCFVCWGMLWFFSSFEKMICQFGANLSPR